MPKMGNVLLLSYYYPPFGQTSSRRSGSLAKYISEFGWNPIVLTRDWNKENGPYDSTIVEGIPENISTTRLSYEGFNHSWNARLISRARQMLFPYRDPDLFYKNVQEVVGQIIKDNNIQAIWATFPPLGDLALAYNISNKYGVPWVADLRDIYQFVDGWGAALMLPLRLFHMNRILKHASAIITVSQGFAKTLNNRLDREITVIPNGFDPDLLTYNNVIKYPKFELVYTGGINLGKPDFRPILDALQMLCKQRYIDAVDVRISFYGYGNEKRLKELMRHPFSRVIVNHGGVSRKESLSYQKKALILLQMTAPGTGWMTSKIYEYLMAQRPILAVPKDGVGIEQLLKETATGVACSTKSEIATQLLEWYMEWKKKGRIIWKGNLSRIMQYSRKEQAKQVAYVLKDIC